MSENIHDRVVQRLLEPWYFQEFIENQEVLVDDTLILVLKDSLSEDADDSFLPAMKGTHLDMRNELLGVKVVDVPQLLLQGLDVTTQVLGVHHSLPLLLNIIQRTATYPEIGRHSGISPEEAVCIVINHQQK